MDRIARHDARRDDNAVDEFAQFEARSLGITGRKRFRKLLHRFGIDSDGSWMQGDDVSLGRRARRASWRSISASSSASLALTIRPAISPLATASTKRAASRRASCSLRSAAALSRDRSFDSRAHSSAKLRRAVSITAGFLSSFRRPPKHRLFDQVKPALAAIAAIPRLDRARAPQL
jgi:hypothetical protein